MEPVPEWMQRLWDAWNVPVMMLLSLFFEIILIFLGNCRRHFTGLWIRIIVCFTYVMADWIVIASVGKLLDIATEKEYSDDNGSLVRVLWGPLLLLQLGSPDTITAYSMKDAYWWSSYVVKLSGPVGMVIYILFKRWTGSWLSILTFPMIVAGIIKYGERLWSLRSAKKTADSFQKENRYMDWAKGILNLQHLFDDYLNNPGASEIHLGTDQKSINQFTFKIIDIELGFMYDMLYTKASILTTNTRVGCLVRFISFFCTIAVLLGFSIISKVGYEEIDVIITYLLLVGAIVLEIYAVTQILYSDWALVLLIKHREKPQVTPILRALAPFLLSNKLKKRWSNSLVRFNLLSFCLHRENKPALFSRILYCFGMKEKLKEYQCQIRVDINDRLQQLMVEQVKDIVGQIGYFRPFNQRGEWTLGKYRLLSELEWSVRVDFYESIIVWHIATDICYYSDNSDAQGKSQRETPKKLSDYMMYLLVRRPYMLSSPTGRFMFRITCDHIVKKFKEIESPLTTETRALKNALTEISSLTDEARTCRTLLTEISSLTAEAQVCKTLLEETEENMVEELPRKRFGRTSTLTDASKVARLLMVNPEKWEIISSVWIEMLCYAATHCLVDHHVEELRRGGEFLTHVWLLLINLGVRDTADKNQLGVMTDELLW